MKFSLKPNLDHAQVWGFGHVFGVFLNSLFWVYIKIRKNYGIEDVRLFTMSVTLLDVIAADKARATCTTQGTCTRLVSASTPVKSRGFEGRRKTDKQLHNSMKGALKRWSLYKFELNLTADLFDLIVPQLLYGFIKFVGIKTVCMTT